MDWTLLHALLEAVGQHPPSNGEADTAVQLASAGFSSLEIILMSVIGTLGTVIGFLFKWAISLQNKYTDLVKDTTADSKDQLHALQGVEKELGRLVTRTERKNGAL